MACSTPTSAGFIFPACWASRAGSKDESGRARFAPLEKPIGPGRLKIVSMGSIEGAGEDQAIMWRGFMLNRAVQHFLEDVRWGDMHSRRGGVSIDRSSPGHRARGGLRKAADAHDELDWL